MIRCSNQLSEKFQLPIEIEHTFTQHLTIMLDSMLGFWDPKLCNHQSKATNQSRIINQCVNNNNICVHSLLWVYLYQIGA